MRLTNKVRYQILNNILNNQIYRIPHSGVTWGHGIDLSEKPTKNPALKERALLLKNEILQRDQHLHF